MRTRLASLVVFAALAASAAFGATLTVDTVTDENDGSCADGDCSLRDALALALDDDEIVFALPGSPPWTIRVQSALGSLAITRPLLITGPGTGDLVISGDSDANGTGDVRILTLAPAASALVSGLTLRDGRATVGTDRDGGCVKSQGDALFVSVRFENCRAWSGALGFTNRTGGHGGAIFSDLGTALSVDLCEFVANVAGKGDIGPDGTFGAPGGSGGAIASLAPLTVRRSTFSGNLAGEGGDPNGAGGEGGAIAALAGSEVLIEDSTFDGNRSGDGRQLAFGVGADGRGGALFVNGITLAVNNSTLSGNQIGGTVPSSGSAAAGGAIEVAGGTVRLRNVTVAGNVANGAGGGVSRSGGTLRVRNSVVALNAGAGANDDCVTNAAGSLISEGFNLVGVVDGCAASFVATGDQTGTVGSPLDPVLGALAANGGPTSTRALLAGSPAIDAGETPDCLGWDPLTMTDVPLVLDQRGAPRPVDGDGDTVAVCDPGAYEAPAGTTQEWLLTVSLAGGGSGSVASAPAGIVCPGDCSELYLDGTPVTLTPTADPGSVFTGWSGDCSGTGSCQVTMDQDRSVTASFEQLFTLDVSVVGSGTVTSSPPGIDCPSDCTEDYQDGTPVTLTATPAVGFAFTGWSGDCSGSGNCMLTMDQSHAATATFVALRTLTVSVVGTGTVTSSPAGISCPSDCTEDYLDGTPVALTATPAAGFQFVGWSGACTGTGTCNLTMTQNRTVTATFEAVVQVWTLDVVVGGPGTGTVTSSPPGIACPGDCTEDYVDGTPVTLTATPTGESYFVGWGGDCSGTGACQLTMDQAHAVTADFDTMPFLDGFETGDTSRWSSSVP